jgi:F0F1-type ATP synthase alpha subunit
VAEETNGLLTIHEQLKKLNHAVFEDDGKVELIKDRVIKVESKGDWHDKEIIDIKGDMKSILENTTWIKRALLTALIGTLSTGLLGGAIALIWTVFKKGIGE